MSNRSAARQSRAEARRRARLAAQGQATDVETDDEAAPAPSSTVAGGGFLQRLIPPAPPLQGKGDPLAGFSYSGPARGIVEGLYVLARNPFAWLIPGLIWLLAGLLPQTDSTIALITSIGQYVALIGAGWIGWRRPWLYGVAAAFVGWTALAVTIVIRYVSNPQLFKSPSGTIPTAGDLALVLASQTALQLLVGFVAGWYGGYLRRRLADQRPRPATATRTRRR